VRQKVLGANIHETEGLLERNLTAGGEEEEDKVKEATNEEEEEEEDADGKSNREEEEGGDGAGEQDFESDCSMDGNMQNLRRIVGRGLHPKKGGTKK